MSTRPRIAVAGVHVLDVHAVGIESIPDGSEGQLVETIRFSAAGTAGDGALHIAVIPKGTTHEFWKSIHAGAMKAARDEAAENVAVEIIWKGPMREDDREQQVQVVEGFTAQQVDGIVLAPLDVVEEFVAPPEGHDLPFARLRNNTGCRPSTTSISARGTMNEMQA